MVPYQQYGKGTVWDLYLQGTFIWRVTSWTPTSFRDGFKKRFCLATDTHTHYLKFFMICTTLDMHYTFNIYLIIIIIIQDFFQIQRSFLFRYHVTCYRCMYLMTTRGFQCALETLRTEPFLAPVAGKLQHFMKRLLAIKNLNNEMSKPEQSALSTGLSDVTRDGVIRDRSSKDHVIDQVINFVLEDYGKLVLQMGLM